jgi:hypothetical protein
MAIHGQRVTVDVASVERTRNSSSGNPTFTLNTSHGVYRTEPDSQVNHFLSENTTGHHELVLSERARVTDIATPRTR